MARLTRHELKQDEFKDTIEELERFAKEKYREIAAVAGIVVVVVGLAAGLKYYAGRQEAEANARLGAALSTFRAYVGEAGAANPNLGQESFATAREKYKKALGQFAEVIHTYPRSHAAAIARYHQGLCQAQLGDDAAAVRTLQEATRPSDRAIAALAQLALGNELAKTGKVPEAVKLFQDLADHPTVTVPRATALLALADAYRETQPAQARQVYERLQKEFASDATLAQEVKQQVASLPR